MNHLNANPGNTHVNNRPPNNFYTTGVMFDTFLIIPGVLDYIDHIRFFQGTEK